MGRVPGVWTKSLKKDQRGAVTPASQDVPIVLSAWEGYLLFCTCWLTSPTFRNGFRIFVLHCVTNKFRDGARHWRIGKSQALRIGAGR
jgi:hypothetical protein